MPDATTNAIEVSELGPGALPDAWTAWVAGHPDATLYHTAAWREFIREEFGHEPRYLMARDETGIAGGLPLFRVRLPGVRPKFISIPYDIGSSVLARDATTERALAEGAIAVARREGGAYLELRCRSLHPVLETLGFQTSRPVVISEVRLDSATEIWNRVSRRHREYIRVAARRGVHVREGQSMEDYRAFYDVYLRVFRSFATPPYPWSYFARLHERLHGSGAARLLLAEVGGRCVGGLTLFCHNKRMTNKFAVCLPGAEPTRAMIALYARALELGLSGGFLRLSLGSSAPSQQGLITFKERWGAVTEAAVVHSLPIRGSVPALDRYFESDTIPRRMWRYLPLIATRLIGGPLNRWFC